MPYRSIRELPEQVKQLPADAQRIFLRVFNDSFDKYGESRSFAIAYQAVKNAGYKKVGDKWQKSENVSKNGDKVNTSAMMCTVDVKKSTDQQMVFGWASVVEQDGKPVIDLHGDEIDSETLEKAVYEYVLESRRGDDSHFFEGTAEMIESMYFSKEKQEALGIDLGRAGWFVGYKVSDAAWPIVKEGRFAFSIGGKAIKQS